MTTYLLIGIVYALVNANTVKNGFESKEYQNYEKMLDSHHKFGKFLKTLGVIALTLELVALWPVILVAFDVVPSILIRINKEKAKKMYLNVEKLHNNTVNYINSGLTELDELNEE